MATLFPSVLPTPIMATALRSSAEIDYNAAAATFTIAIAPYTFIEDVVVDCTTSFSVATPTLTVGDSTSATLYLSAAQTTGVWATANTVTHSLPAFGGRLYTAANTLYFAWTPVAAGTQGVAYIYVAYHYLPGSAASGAMMAGYQ
jgi:hypothetical protein